jgi:carotenoid cleavage dioxygenase
MSPLETEVANYRAPVEREVESEDLPVSGRIPPELNGSYVRNGPNPRGASGHWFFGDGMLHGIRLAGGRAQRYANRWVRTSTFETGARSINGDGTFDLRAGVANTSVVAHAGRVLALVESSFPCEVTTELETVGVYDFAGRLRTPMTAHPKVCPVTGELLFFGYSPMPQLPALAFHRADPAGALVESRAIEVPGRTMMHDFAITSGHAIFLDLPVVFELERAKAGTMPYCWSDDYGARLGVMRRGGDGTVRWFEIEPCYVFHVLNAFEEGERIVLDAVRYREMWRASADTFGDAFLHRWTLDLASGAVSESQLDDTPVEFPRTLESRTGLAYRYGYALGEFDGERSGIVKYDLATHATSRFVCDAGKQAGEFAFAAAPDARAEDDGWLVGYVYDRTNGTSDFVILEARELTQVAGVRLPQRVPAGFHGTWLSADA